MQPLSETHLRFAVGDCLRERDPTKRALDAIQRRLAREDSAAVSKLYDAATLGSCEASIMISEGGGGMHGLLAARLRALRRPLMKRDRDGLPLSEIAKIGGMSRKTLVALMEHHGYVETVPFGRDKRRCLVTEQAFQAELGHNVDPGAKRSPRLDGIERSVPFAVFYEEHVYSILWTLDLEGVTATVRLAPSKGQRIALAMRQFSFLPNSVLADLCECSVRGIEEARRRRPSKQPYPFITHNHTLVVPPRRAPLYNL